jgi:WD40 repeat protein
MPGRHDVLREYVRLLRRESHNLRRRPDLLWQQVYDRLQFSDIVRQPSAYRDRILAELEARRASPRAPWLLLRTDVYEAGSLVRTFVGHRGQVTSCRFLPGTGLVVSAGLDGLARTWSMATGVAVEVFAGHRGAIEACDVSPDGSRILTAGTDRTVRLWDAASGREVAALLGHGDKVVCCAYGRDGRHVVSGSRDLTCRVWDVTDGSCTTVFTGHQDPVAACALSPTCETVASCSKGSLIAWDRRTGRTAFSVAAHAGLVTSCAFSHDGRAIVTSGWDGTAKLWDAVSGAPLASIACGSIVSSVGLDPEGTLLAWSDVEGGIRIWDLRASRLVATLTGHAGPVESCAFDADATHLLSAGDDRTLKLWDVGAALATGGPDVATRSTEASLCRFTPGGQVVVATADEILVRHVEADPGSPPPTRLAIGESQAVSFGYDPTGGLVAIGCADRGVRVVSLRLGRRVLDLEGHMGWVTACAFSRDGRRLATGSRDTTVRIWDAARGNTLTTLSGHEERVTACAFSPDGRRLVSASWDETLKIWDLDRRTLTATLWGHADRVTSCVFSPDGWRVLSASHDRTVRLWDASSGELQHELRGHAGAVTCCGFSPDGRFAVSGGEDETLIVWSTASPGELARFIGVGLLVSCDVGPDGRTICCTDTGGRLYLLDLFAGPVR